MSRIMMKTVPVIGICVALLLLTSAAVAAPAEIGGGKEWLAWSPAERNVYIRGFIEGYWRGTHSTCELADDLFEVGKPHRLYQGPSGRCEARLDNYTKIETPASKPDFTAYTTVMTEFYTKYPEYQNIPQVYLMSFLTDRNYKTADQLYQMAVKGEMRTHF
jgi:hypothetical protein